MPRKRPARVRLNAPRPRRPWESRAVIPGLSARAQAEVACVERERPRFGPGKGYTAFRAWRDLADLPGEGVIYLSDSAGISVDEEYVLRFADGWRDILEELMCALSPPSALEMRAVLAPLDERIHRRTLPDPAAPAHGPWWRRRLRSR